MRLLVVEDEKRLAASLKRGLESDGFAVDVALDGTGGLWMAAENEYDAIVLDIMLPGINGYELCGRLREAGNWTPILMLTAKDRDFSLYATSANALDVTVVVSAADAAPQTATVQKDAGGTETAD